MGPWGIEMNRCHQVGQLKRVCVVKSEMAGRA